MKTLIFWLVLLVAAFVLVLFKGGPAAMSMSALALAGVLTALARKNALSHHRRMMDDWNKTHDRLLQNYNEDIARLRDEATDLKLERSRLQTQSDMRALVIETFLMPENVDRILHELAVAYERACAAQRNSLLRASIQSTDCTVAQEDLEHVEAQFVALQNDNARLKQHVDAAKAKFWKAHDLVVDTISEGLLDSTFAVRRGRSFTKYLQEDCFELQTLDEARREQKLGEYAEGRNEPPGQ